MTKKWLTSFVEELTLQPLGRLRMDCPVCNKKNTFSVADDGFERMYNCFYAGCDTRGFTGKRLTKSNSKSAFMERVTKADKIVTDNFVLPDTFVPLTRSDNAVQYVRKVYAYNAYLTNKADIMYDVRQNRVVFLVKKNRKVVDAVGKALDNRRPKWYRYGKSSHPFICGDKSHVFVVEDCASACSISDITTGVALLGTNLLSSHLEVIQGFDRAVVALDKDATSKAVDISRKISQVVNCKVAFLPDDLKNLKDEERERIIRKYID